MDLPCRLALSRDPRTPGTPRTARVRHRVSRNVTGRWQIQFGPIRDTDAGGCWPRVLGDSRAVRPASRDHADAQCSDYAPTPRSAGPARPAAFGSSCDVIDGPSCRQDVRTRRPAPKAAHPVPCLPDAAQAVRITRGGAAKDLLVFINTSLLHRNWHRLGPYTILQLDSGIRPEHGTLKVSCALITTRTPNECIGEK